jgi:Mg-chelatase subunit ChlD
MRFANPAGLIFLASLPLFLILGWPSRGSDQRRETVSLGLRLIMAACLILALAGLETLRASRDLSVVFLIDASDSMPPAAKSAAEDYVRRAISKMGAEDQSAVIVFGGDALVERPMSSSRELDKLTSVPDTGQTDIAAAIRLGLALYSPDSARRMVILSDGTLTGGDALEAARLARASNVQIMALLFSVEGGAEAIVTEAHAPSRLHPGERFDLDVTIQATQSMQAGVRVLAGGEIVYEGTLNLERGSQSFTVPLSAGRPGFVRYTVQIDPEKDTFYQNNELSTYSQVEGPPRILVVAPPPGEPITFQGDVRPDESTALVRALESAQLNVNLVTPSRLPSDLAPLAEYRSVVLVDVPARDLSQKQMSTLQSYVRDLGGGLVTIGGPTSYGVGGYFKTPLEEALPLEMQIKDQQRRPTLSIVFIIDHSGSMSEGSGGVTKLELAKEAAMRSIELLFPSDRVGVIAFDDSASWVVPITDLSDPGAVMNAIGSIRSGGGTDILAGLQAMANVLPDDPSRIKHVILLTDGGANPQGIPELVQRLYRQNGITLTSVGVGRDAAPFLEDIAQLAGGRYHFTADPSTIPSIFTEETTLASRSYIVEDTFTPNQVSSSPILSGLDGFPPLHGYVGTTAKQAARTILASTQKDPILAAWQYGLGKTVAFTSDASGRWASDWISWDGFATFWSQAVNYTLKTQNGASVEVQVLPRQDKNQLIVDARSTSGDYLNDYSFKANVVAPDGSVSEIELSQVASGRYEGEFAAALQGAYLIGVSGNPSQGTSPQVEQVFNTAGWVLSYPPEYRRLDADPDLLAQIASLTGGNILSEDPGNVFAHTLPAPRSSRPIWPGLVALAALCLPFDIALRRLAVSRSEVQRALYRLLDRLEFARPDQIPAPPKARHIESLLRAKARSRENLKLEATPVPPSNSPAEIQVLPKAKDQTPKPHEDEPVPGKSTAEILLDRKRRIKNRP